ncbi:MAG: hypothetical protein ACLRZO_13470 [Eggerthella lenta]
MRLEADASSLTQHVGWIRVADEPNRNRLALTVSELFDEPLPSWRTRRLFDADCLPAAWRPASLTSMRACLPPPASRACGCRAASTASMAVRAILGQQITVKAAGVGRTRRARVLIAGRHVACALVRFRLKGGTGAAERLGELG